MYSVIDVIDIKPDTMEELSEVITCAEYHPSDSSLLAYGTSRGAINLIDTRARAIYDKATVALLESRSPSSAGDDRSRVYHTDPLYNHSSYSQINPSGPASQLARIAGASAGSPAPVLTDQNTSFFNEMVT